MIIIDTETEELVKVLQDTIREYEESLSSGSFQKDTPKELLYTYTRLAARQTISSDMAEETPLLRRMIYRMLRVLYPGTGNWEGLLNCADTLFVLFCTPQEETEFSSEIDEKGDEGSCECKRHLSYLVRAHNCLVQGIDVASLQKQINEVRRYSK